jgi:hypothetical protein
MVWSCLDFNRPFVYCCGYLFFCIPFPLSLPENETTLLSQKERGRKICPLTEIDLEFGKN